MQLAENFPERLRGVFNIHQIDVAHQYQFHCQASSLALIMLTFAVVQSWPVRLRAKYVCFALTSGLLALPGSANNEHSQPATRSPRRHGRAALGGPRGR